MVRRGKKEERMKIFRAIQVVFALALLGVVVAAPARAQGVEKVSKKTTVTIARPMEVPGGRVLQPGTYIFKVTDVVGNRNIMQITNKDETQAIAMIIAVPDYRLEPTEKPVVQYKEEAAGRPTALRAWFFGHEKGGLEFVYPKKRAVELAEATHEYVPAEASVAPVENIETMKTEPLVAITPEGKEEPMAQAFEQNQLTRAEPNEVAQALPKTASPVPLIALIGVALVAAGFGLKKLAGLRS